MTDRVDAETRSRIMRTIRGRDTGIELALKPTLESIGFEHQPRMPCRPDFAHAKERVAVFLDSCFWHGCPRHFKPPRTNAEYWAAKIERNRSRDRGVDALMRMTGWRVIRVWEHDLKGLQKAAN